MKRIDKVLLASIAPLTIVSTSSLLTSCSKEIHYTAYFKTKAMANDIYVIDASTLSADLVVTLESLQGILAQEKAQIYISHCDKNDPDGLRDNWFASSVRKYPEINIHDVDETKIWDFILGYKNKFNNKYVLYTNATQTDNERDENKSINIATTIAGMEHYLMISKDLEANAISHGLTLGANANQMQTEDVFNQYKNRLNNKILINQSPYDFPLRDYAIAAQALTTYLDNETDQSRDTISKWLVDNSVMLGWCKNELDFVAAQSKYNLPILAADHCTNLSFYSHYKQPKLKQKYHREAIKAQPGKHYVAVVMSDGDNLQWLQKDFTYSTDWYMQDEGYRGQFPVTWTMSPAVYDLNPAILDYLYGNMTPNDQFVAGPSGYSYANMAQYQDIESYAKITADYMAKCDLNYVNVLDYYDCDYRKFEALMQQKQVKGAVWCNKDLYLSGKGAVDWINGKPIVSMREGLWWNIDKPAEKLEYKWDAVANRIKSYPKDPTIIDGYTIITANAWQSAGKMPGIKALVDEFSPADNVEFVTVDQILQLITDNVKHVHAEPEAHAPVPVP